MALRLLLDTSAYSAFKRGHPRVVELVRAASSIALNAIVLGELLSGFTRGGQVEQNRRELEAFHESPRVRVLQMGPETAERFALVHRALHDAGTPIPTHDMWIAASALEHGLRVLTTDAHFLRIATLPTEYVSLSRA